MQFTVSFFFQKKKLHELYQIKVCFDPSLHLVDCDGIKASRQLKNQGSCPENGILYPDSVTSGGKHYSYPRRLVDLHRMRWEESQGTCRSWICYALKIVSSLMWMS
ncbi:hypothetical protein SK128_006618 [Halocaridina rubra]|uniref:Uncharacterized protein n=1 Tax=Halocaridina rubra TaxID=373956 RepID=A0AAN8XBD6_HALRR